MTQITRNHFLFQSIDKSTFFLDRPALSRFEVARNIAFAVSSMAGSEAGAFDIHSDIDDSALPDSS